MRHALIVAVVLAACTDEPAASGPQVTSHVDYHEFPAVHPPAIDMLLVIDNTSSMTPYQSQIAQLPSIVDGVVTRIYGGLPDVHVAVTTNGGALSTVLDDTGHWDGSHTRNFDGSLADALAPLVAVGTSSAGPAQPLAAMKTALEVSPDFARPYASLGVVTFSATDDGSPSFDYVTWLKGTKSDPANIIVSGVYPQPSTVLDAFHDSFPNRSTITSIDATDYTPAFAQFQLVRVPLGAGCFDLPLDIDPNTSGDQYDCDVSGWDDTTGLELARLPACNGADPATGTCWEYIVSPNNCTLPSGELHLRGTWSFFHPTIRIQCVVK